MTKKEFFGNKTVQNIISSFIGGIGGLFASRVSNGKITKDQGVAGGIILAVGGTASLNGTFSSKDSKKILNLLELKTKMINSI